MRFHRFLISEKLNIGILELSDTELIHQVSSVLRLKAGDQLLLLDGYGLEATACIDSVERKKILVRILSVADKQEENALRTVTLYCSVLRRENFEWVVQKATEVGVSTIVPLLTERTVKTGVRMDRLTRIMREAVEQCGRTVLPILHDPIQYQEALKKSTEQSFFFHLSGAQKDWKNGIKNGSDISVWIGPEGGWSDAEVEQAAERGFVMSSLGPLALRAETAAIIATYEACQG